MAEILAAGAVIIVLAVVVAWLLRGTENRGDRTDRTVNANHHGLYLLVNDLVSAQTRGWTTVFPDQQTLDRARDLLAGYEEQITGLGPRLAPVERVELPGPDD